VAYSSPDVVHVRLSSLDHVPLTELHALGTSATKLATYNHLHPTCTGFHDQLDDTVASAADSKAAEQLEAKRLSLRLSASPTVRHTLHKELHSVGGKLKPGVGGIMGRQG
jgi:hypothetical protein